MAGMRNLFLILTTMCLAPLLAAQQINQAEEPASAMAPAETLSAYRSSLNLGAALGFEPVDPDPSDRPNYGSLGGFAIIPFEVPLELTAVDPAAWANATVGSTLTFRVVNAVIVRGMADAYAETLIKAKVVRIRQGKSLTRHGQAEPRVKEIVFGKSIKMELESSPGVRARFNVIAKNVAIWSVKVPYYAVVMVPEDLLLAIACSRGCDL
jgi:hypothetical protein